MPPRKKKDTETTETPETPAETTETPETPAETTEATETPEATAEEAPAATKLHVGTESMARQWAGTETDGGFDRAAIEEMGRIAGITFDQFGDPDEEGFSRIAQLVEDSKSDEDLKLKEAGLLVWVGELTKKVADLRANATEENEGEPKALHAAAKARRLIDRLPVKHRTKLKKAVTEAAKTKIKPAPIVPVTPATPASPETTSIDDIPNGRKLIAEGIEVFSASIKAAAEVADRARVLSEIGLKVRLGSRNKWGTVDLRLDSKAGKDAMAEVIKGSLAAANPENPDNEDAYKTMLTAYQNRNVDVVAEFVQSLDGENAEQFETDGFQVIREHFDPEAEENEGLTASEAVWKYFEQLPGKGLPRHTRAERGRLDRARKKQLAERVTAGELSADEAEELGGDRAPKTPEQEDFERIERARKNFSQVTSRGKKMDNAHRNKVRDALDKLISDLAKARAAL
ncbi:hypothetical protein ACFV84_01925 [Kitasatospora sp. NPDC059811]|uniref:hypothetical protein n=1 Tax=Kitasatospora sp. NPDC059811 TaxID=3346957 RepID=UPI003650238E